MAQGLPLMLFSALLLAVVTLRAFELREYGWAGYCLFCLVLVVLTIVIVIAIPPF